MKIASISTASIFVLLSFAAQATDLQSRKSPPAAPSAAGMKQTWDGAYVGGNLGSGRSKTSGFSPDQVQGVINIDAFRVGSISASGLIGGAQIGFDRQFGDYVLGVQAMYNFSNIKGSAPFFGNPDERISSELNWVGTLTGRVGYLIKPQVLLYLKGGLALAKFTNTDHYQPADPAAVYYGTNSATRNGIVIGGGLEYAFDSNWSVFFEYSRFDFGNKIVKLNYSGEGIWWGTTTWDVDYKHQLDALHLGVNYRF